MAVHLASPRGLLSDEEEGGAAVFESTAADICALAGPRTCDAALPEVSLIFPGAEPRKMGPEVSGKVGAGRRGSEEEDGTPEKVRVYLRVRPLTELEKGRGEDQGCVCIQSEETLILQAPKHSFNMKSSERGVGQSLHKFTFTQISGPDTTQQEFFERTMRENVRDVLRGENRLLYTYGVTNSGKTYTVQGLRHDAGLLPRALVSVFGKLQGRLYGALDLKPILCQEVRWLDSNEVRAEEIRRDTLLKEVSCWRWGLVSCDSGIGGVSSMSCITTHLEDSDSVCLDTDSLSHSGDGGLEEGVQFSVWVSFFEIYNEFLYDLLETPSSLQPRKRATLRLSDDRYGNPYVKDLTWVQVRSAEEAWKVLKVGRRNQSFASTHLNHNSSRSHSIFSIRILHIRPEMELGKGTQISELTVCDLAGSERCKDQSSGERMKEANNINTSLHTLGRCIAALRHNQTNRSRPPMVVPFRDSKLTRVLQGFFCGRGRSVMVVNINPCASMYDETLQALKFSAIATQLVHAAPSRTRVAYIQALLREHALRSQNATLEEEQEEYSDDENQEDGDVTMFDSEALLRAIEVLKAEVHRQRKEKEELEGNVREQVCSEMMEVITRMENDFSETLETERALMEERYEEKISNLQKNLKRYYTEEIEERDEQIEFLTAALQKSREAADAELGADLSSQSGLRRSRRLASASASSSSSAQMAGELMTGELSRVRAELEQCRAELLAKTKELRQYQDLLILPPPAGTLTAAADRKLQEGQRSLRQLRLDLQRLGLDLQSAERACCSNTGGERLRQALAAADDTLAKQGQALAELQNSLLLVKMDLRKKTDSLAEMQARVPAAPTAPAPSSCKRRGCGGAILDTENQPHKKRPLLHSLFGHRTVTRGAQASRTPTAPSTPYSRILRSRQRSPPGSPTIRGFVF
uniref:Kinesin-like protein n=1 Tax=Scleropages formosus TaxID=113540 RepID=A0A8C9RQ40_SCLFO